MYSAIIRVETGGEGESTWRNNNSTCLATTPPCLCFFTTFPPKKQNFKKNWCVGVWLVSHIHAGVPPPSLVLLYRCVLCEMSFSSAKVLIVQVVFKVLYCSVSTWSTSSYVRLDGNTMVSDPLLIRWPGTASFAGLQSALTDGCCANPCKTDSDGKLTPKLFNCVCGPFLRRLG